MLPAVWQWQCVVWQGGKIAAPATKRAILRAAVLLQFPKKQLNPSEREVLEDLLANKW